ncbi:MAG: vanadium-dependent haloperoxidase [Acidobacteriia bacterium]|nr:vanadium-dependent haloperoxidase [Terriglobia bacterium]
MANRRTPKNEAEAGLTKPETSRRQFFSGIAGAGTVALGAGSLALPTPGLALGQDDQRRQETYSLRSRMAEYYRDMPGAAHPTNGDEERYGNKINAFSKTLLHNPLGEVSRDSFSSMVRALESGSNSDFDAILRGGNVRLKNPQAAYTRQMMGADASQITLPAPPAFSSARQAANIIENYWMALARDIPYNEYASNSIIAQACDDLSRLSDYAGPKENGRVTPNTIFRGNTPGDLEGPYVSQFLLQNAPVGSQILEQKQRSLLPGVDFMTDVPAWLTIQLGIGKGAGVRLEDTARYMRNGRDMANFVHVDQAYSPYYPAAWILLHLGDVCYSEDNPYVWSKSQDAFATFGPPDALEFTARAAKPGYNAAWYQKWMVHRHARPEVFAGRIHHHLAKLALYPIHDEALHSKALELTAAKYGTFLLPQAYTEGSPAHSSYPAGHATVAGASVTMLKAFFRESAELPNPVIASSDGTSLIPYSGPPLTVGNELNKLAYNVAMGRNFAGIHYRYDAVDSIRLGEEVAINLLRDMTSTYAEFFGGFSFTRFDGSRVTICPYC